MHARALIPPDRSALARLAGLLFLLCASLLCAAAVSASPKLTLDPASIALAPGESDRVLLKVEGQLPSRASVIVSNPAAVNSSVARVGPSRKGGNLWIITATANAGFSGDATALVMLHGGPQVVAVPLPIKAKAKTGVEAQIAATLSLESETLLDGLDTPLLVKVSNLSDQPMTVDLQLVLSSFITAKQGDWRQRVIPPRSTSIVPIILSTDSKGNSAVVSGKHEVAVVVTAQHAGSEPWSGQAIASTTVSVGIPGLEAVQGVLQVPSFLLLPGFLLVAAYMLVSRFVSQCRTTETEKDGILSLGWSAGHWVVAITLSIGLIGAYPHLMRMWLGAPRSILYGFDLGDVIRVWVLSLLLGGLGALLAAGARTAYAKWRARSALSLGLAPLDLLNRLALRNFSATLTFVVRDDDSKLYALPYEASDGQAWVASAIKVTVLDAARLDRARLSTVRRDGNAEEIRRFLQSAVSNRLVSLEWGVSGNVRGIGQVPEPELAETEGPESIISPA